MIDVEENRRINRERWGRVVREAWIEWAKLQPSPKPSWLVPYDGLSEPDKEADRMIGEAVVKDMFRGMQDGH